jgi:hypothetical protein
MQTSSTCGSTWGVACLVLKFVVDFVHQRLAYHQWLHSNSIRPHSPWKRTLKDHVFKYLCAIVFLMLDISQLSLLHYCVRCCLVAMAKT